MSGPPGSFGLGQYSSGSYSYLTSSTPFSVEASTPGPGGAGGIGVGGTRYYGGGVATGAPSSAMNASSMGMPGSATAAFPGANSSAGLPPFYFPTSIAAVAATSPTPGGENQEEILAELTKIKKQNAVLKKAVLLEQQKSQSLEAAVKEKEIQLRTASEESDLLNLNIGRLTKRIQLLQDQLSEKQPKESSGWFSKSSSDLKKQDELNAARSELEMKIRENEELHMKNYELKTEHEQTVQMLQQKLTAMKKSLQKQHDDQDEMKKAHEATLQALAAEKTALQERVAETEAQMQRLRAVIEEKEKFEKLKDAALRQELERMTQSLQEATPAVPTFNPEVSPAVGEPQIDFRSAGSLIDGALNALRQLVTAFEEHHGYSKDKLEVLVESPSLSPAIAPVYRQLIDSLVKHNQYFEATLANLYLISHDLKENRPASFEKRKIFSDSVQDFLRFNSSLLTTQIQALEIESQEAVDAGTQSNNQQIITTYGTIRTEVEKIGRDIIDFVGSVSNDGLLQFIQHLTTGFDSLRGLYKTLAGQLQTKFATEHSPFETKSANNSIVRSFTMIQSFLGKLTNLSREFANLVPKVEPQPAPTAATPTNSEAEQQEGEVSIPELREWKETIAKLGKGLVSKLAETQTKLSNAELERTRLRRELMSAKDAFAAKQAQVSGLLTELAELRSNTGGTLSKGSSNASDLLSFEAQSESPQNARPLEPKTPPMSIEAQSRFAMLEDLSTINDISSASTSGQKKYSMIVVDDNGKEYRSLNVSEEERSREQSLKRFFEQKLAQLSSQLQIADEKGLQYHSENQLSLQEVQKLTKERERLQQEIQRLEGLIKLAKDDLDLTRANYDSQLKVLTEFVMNLKDQVGIAEDEVKQLKKHKVRCIKCKNWNTVEWLLSEGRGGQLCRGGNHYSGYNYG